MGVLYLTRHGETEWNRKNICMGQKDIELNKKGIEQAYRLGKKIKNLEIDFIITSPLIRCRKTAEIVNEYINKKIIIEPRLIEVDTGMYEGLSDKKIIVKVYNEIIPGGETANTVQKRVFKAIEKLKQKYLDKKILIVAHGFVGNMIYKYFNPNISEREFFDFIIKNAEIKKFKF